jgi:hypothetical protein
MSEARTVWHEMQSRRTAAVKRQRSGIALVVLLLVTMSSAEVLFLRYVAGPDTTDLLTAAG